MDQWIIKQLRAFVLHDLKAFIPKDYFEQRIEILKLADTFENHEYLNYEYNWGYLAGKLGQRLYFQSPLEITPRQTAASELLMNLGMLASSKSALSACEQIHEMANKHQLPDGNSGNIAKQFREKHIPIFEENIKGALEQYLLHLTREEAKPYLSLLPKALKLNTSKSKDTEDIIEIKPNFMGLGFNINALWRKIMD